MNFPFNIGNKQIQLKNNPIIIINQIHLGMWICKFFPAFQAHGNGMLQCIKQ